MANKLYNETSVQNIANAIRNKNGTANTYTIGEMANAILELPSGGAPAEDVVFYDYDGTVIATYSKNDFANLSSMPANPTHTGLTSQGWNWTLSDAKAYVSAYGGLDIGQMYVTSNGATKIYVSLDDTTLKPYLGFAINGTATVDWGDGNTETVTGTSTTTVVNTQHIYSQAGDYVISISSSTDIYFIGASTGSKILWKNSNVSGANRGYNSCIKKVEIGNNMTSIDNYAFQYCAGLETITIPNTITSIGTYSFAYCFTLKSILFPTGMTSIGNYCMTNCYQLYNISLPKNLANIGNNVFAVSSISKIYFPNNNNITLGTQILSSCSNIKTIVFPNEITNIPDSTYSSCNSLPYYEIPSTITTIGTYVFQNCIRLEYITIPNTITSIGAGCFYSCSSLSELTLPSTITSLGNSLFNGCYALTGITIPSTVTTIGTSVFSGCACLTKLVFPSGLVSIAASAFSNCSSIEYFDFSDCNSIPSLANKNAFSGMSTDCKIIVPDNLYNSWIGASNWSNYASYIIKESDWND